VTIHDHFFVRLTTYRIRIWHIIMSNILSFCTLWMKIQVSFNFWQFGLFLTPKGDFSEQIEVFVIFFYPEIEITGKFTLVTLIKIKHKLIL